MHFGLSEEQEMIVDTVRSFVENEIYPHEDIVERTGEVPAEVAEAIKQKTIDLGFYACNFPQEVGGAGLSHLEFALVERELGRGAMALNHFFGRPQNILMACEWDQTFYFRCGSCRFCDLFYCNWRRSNSEGAQKTHHCLPRRSRHARLYDSSGV